MKTETLYDAFLNCLINKEFKTKEDYIAFKGAEFGAKWQQERSYSKEDMKICWQEATEDMRKQFSTSYSGMTFEKFIEHYKK